MTGEGGMDLITFICLGSLWGTGHVFFFFVFFANVSWGKLKVEDLLHMRNLVLYKHILCVLISVIKIVCGKF